MTLNSRGCIYRRRVLLLDGRVITLRSICSDDKSGVIAFFSRLSDDTRFLRFQYMKRELTESELRDYCDIDYYNTLALVAEEEDEGQLKIIGIGRYCRLRDDNSAEVAFAVEDGDQGKGVGTHLLTHLALLAQQRHVDRFIAELLRVNFRMLSIFRKSDPNIEQTNFDDSTCAVNFSVDETAKKYSQ